MGLFGNKKEGGILDVIRCDEPEYLVWKWSPAGEPSRKMNSIRYGSRLRVKEGEVAVFVYDNNGKMDFIEGFRDEVLKTANFPVLSSIVGAAFGGASPFQAEVFFINTAGSIRLPFFVKRISLSEKWQQRLFVPASVKGAITFSITDYRAFISKFQMSGYSMDDFSMQIRETVERYVKAVVSNAPFKLGIPVVQIERGIDLISDEIRLKLREQMASDFAVELRRVDIADIALDEESEGYKALMSQGKAQADIIEKQFLATGEAASRNILDQQKIGAENLAESLRINREETQRLQRLATEEAHMTAHRLDVQGDVAKTAAESLGELGGGLSGDGGDGLNPASMMAGMMLGGAVGSNMAGMMNSMMQGVGQVQTPPAPAMSSVRYFLYSAGRQSGPYTLEQVRQMFVDRQITAATYIWKQGMADWVTMASMPELEDMVSCPPPPPPVSAK